MPEKVEGAAVEAAPSRAVVQAVAIAAAFAGGLDLQWSNEDDKCDCTFQRVGYWANPYLAETLEVRLCCTWAWLFAKFPEMSEFMHVSKVFRDPNTDEVRTEPAPWDSDEHDMTRALWYRQLARTQDKPLSEIRAEYAERQTPRRVAKKQRR